MLTLELLIGLTLLGALASFWWHSDRIKQLALRQVLVICRQQSLQLLDQTMVLRGLGIARGPDGRLSLRRRYQFEFTSTGSARYQGKLELLGRNMVALEMEPHILPEDDPRLH